MLKSVCSFFAFLLLLLTFGCDGGKYGKVSGKLTIDGEPIEGAEVHFEPDDGAPSVGETDSSGNYSLKMSPTIQGAAIGQHTVTITTATWLADENGRSYQKPELVPEQYQEYGSIRREVKSGRQTIDFELKSDQSPSE